MPKAKQLTVSIENRPGTLASVANALGHAKVNILAFLSGASGAEGYVQLVVDDVNKAEDALEDGGFSYSVQDVLHIEVQISQGRWVDLLGSSPPTTFTLPLATPRR